MDYFKKKQKEFSALKYALISVVVLALVFTGIREYFNWKKIQELTGKVYAIQPQKGIVLELEKRDYTIGDREKEYEAHTYEMVKHFYQFDQYTFMDNMDRSKNYFDKESFKREIAKYQEENTFSILQERDIVINTSNIDVNIYISKIPVRGTLSFTQQLRTLENSNKRIIEATFNIVDTNMGRSFDNSHACIITNYQITRKEIIP